MYHILNADEGKRGRLRRMRISSFEIRAGSEHRRITHIEREARSFGRRLTTGSRP